ncbi:MAG: response regulator [bacterium]
MAKGRATGDVATEVRVLVVDDAPDTLELLQRNLASQGYRVFTASSAPDALAILASMRLDLLVTDIRMPGMSGIELIREVRAQRPEVEIIVITGYATIGGAVEALQVGAWDYLAKPFTDEELFQAVRRVVARRPATESARGPARLFELHGMLGRCQAMRTLFDALGAAARQEGAVLLRGEPGSGREAAARALHALAGCDGPFSRVGPDVTWVETADLPAGREGAKGTLYLASLDRARHEALDHVAARLLPEGKRGRGRVPARVVASVAASPDELARLGGRIAEVLRRFAVTVTIPPLRERGDDVVLLANRFLAESASSAGTPARTLTEAVEQAFRVYPWPGNVRELRELAAQLMLAGRSGPIVPSELPAWIAGASGRDVAADLSLAAVEAEHIARALRRTSGNKTRAAEILGIDRKTLLSKLRKRSRRR